MFFNAASFSHRLCTANWVNSTADKKAMFFGSRGSICMPAWVTTRAERITRPLWKPPAFRLHWTNPPPLPDQQQPPQQQASIEDPHQPHPQRDLMARMVVSMAVNASTIASTSMCPKCGTFKKSGRSSCCAPGGAWFNNCGGADNRNVEHSWLEGTKACHRKSSIIAL